MKSASEKLLSGLRGAKHFSNTFRIVFRTFFSRFSSRFSCQIKNVLGAISFCRRAALRNGVRRNGIRNQCPRYGVDAESQYWLLSSSVCTGYWLSQMSPNLSFAALEASRWWISPFCFASPFRCSLLLFASLCFSPFFENKRIQLQASDKKKVHVTPTPFETSRTLRVRILKKKTISLEIFEISLENSNLDLLNSRTKIGVWWVALLKCSISLEISILKGDLKLFQSLGAQGKQTSRTTLFAANVSDS